MDTTVNGLLIFKPRPSKSGLGILIPGVIFLVVSLLLFLFRDSLPPLLVWLTGLAFLVLGLAFLVGGWFLWWAKISMKYVLTQDTLTITGGLLRYDVPIADIEHAYSRDINNTPSNNAPLSANAVNTPGLALANVTWRDTGLLKMCATSWRDVVLIVTSKNTYGITPDDVDGFLGTLSERGVATGEPPTAP
ncbi:MAG: PH domain-containing protein [Chloroflexota bacterium]